MADADAARIYRREIPNSNISIVYNAGHLIELERPEALVAAVVDYVERRETFVVCRESRVIDPKWSYRFQIHSTVSGYQAALVQCWAAIRARHSGDNLPEIEA